MDLKAILYLLDIEEAFVEFGPIKKSVPPYVAGIY